MQKRLKLFSIFPEVAQLYDQLDAAVKQAGIPPLYLELIKIRASQINGCAYCIDKHMTDALKLGEDQRKLNVIGAWREATDWFNDEEQAILRLTEEITNISEHGISTPVYDTAIALFGEEKFARLMMAAISINSWNRLGVGLHSQPRK